MTPRTPMHNTIVPHGTWREFNTLCFIENPRFKSGEILVRIFLNTLCLGSEFIKKVLAIKNNSYII